MSKVHILPPEVISKIAAGEVIERPASVVKELLENAIDAGANEIEIHLKDAGKTLITFKDNGHGIEQEDLEKIFLRHATSKIEKSQDLDAISSLGFRGEALYSIASIADTILKSKPEDQDNGWEIHLRDGKKLDHRPCAFGTKGTEIEIKELFYNTPARKKFLKTNTTEINQILNIVIPYTLLYPQCRFRLSHQGKDLLDLAPCDDFRSRIVDTLHIEEKHILEAKEQFTDRRCSFQMFLGDINIKRTRRDMQFIFINNRPVQNKSISYHMNQIYRLIMPEGFFPFFVVFINIPAENIDVNIHPTKREVKVKDEQAICSLLRSLCEQTLMSSGQVKQVKNYERHDKDDVQRALMGTHTLKESFDASTQGQGSASSDDYAYPRPSSNTQTQDFFIPQDNVLTQKKETLQSHLEQAQYIGSFLNKYLIFGSGNSLLVVDQHAAAERITFEHLMRQMEKGTLEVQHLLAPVLIKLTVQELLVWEESKELLEKSGLSSSQWDKETIAIHTHPVLLKDTEKSVRHILSGEKIEKSDFATMARRACRSSIMAGDRLNQQQAEYQREQLLQCLDPFTCPHGRPTIIEMNENFLDKQFLRT